MESLVSSKFGKKADCALTLLSENSLPVNAFVVFAFCSRINLIQKKGVR
jgi:hypothetical protein